MTNGWLYLVVVMDWFSRYILSWALSNTLDTAFCVSALQAALEMGKPEIFNTDQGSQFTSNLFTSELLNRDIRVSMDGRGRAFDNIFIERFWWTVKYEEVYIKEYRAVIDAYSGLKGFIKFYNDERLHQSLGYKSPSEVHHQFFAWRKWDWSSNVFGRKNWRKEGAIFALSSFKKYEKIHLKEYGILS